MMPSDSPVRQTDVFGRGTVMVDVAACPRCGAPHPSLVLLPLTKPVVAANGTFWSPCPTNLEPLLLQIVDPNDPTKDQFH